MSEKVSRNDGQNGKQWIPKNQGSGEVHRGCRVPRMGGAVRSMRSGVCCVAADCRSQREFYNWNIITRM